MKSTLWTKFHIALYQWQSLKVRFKVASLILKMPVVYYEDVEVMEGLYKALKEVSIEAKKAGSLEKGCYEIRGKQYFT